MRIDLTFRRRVWGLRFGLSDPWRLCHWRDSCTECWQVGPVYVLACEVLGG